LGLKQKKIEHFAKQHLFNNSSVKKQNREQKQTNAPLGPRHWQCTEQFGQLCLASDFTCNMDYTTLQILSRKQLVQLLTKYYQLNFLKSTLHSVPLTDRSVATVPIFDVKALLIAFLNDPLRMRQENFASNYDIFTEKAKSPTSTLDEILTGSFWEQAR
jgi:hypothetical protein